MCFYLFSWMVQFCNFSVHEDPFLSSARLCTLHTASAQWSTRRPASTTDTALILWPRYDGALQRNIATWPHIVYGSFHVV